MNQGNRENSQQSMDEKRALSDLQSSGGDKDVIQLHEWARQEHLEWARYNMDPYYPTCFEYYGQTPTTYSYNRDYEYYPVNYQSYEQDHYNQANYLFYEQDHYHSVNYQSYDQELPSHGTGNFVPNYQAQEPKEVLVAESESDDDDDDDSENQIPDGIFVLWEMLRGDGEVDVAADENNN
jgi:hypothetical protein